MKKLLAIVVITCFVSTLMWHTGFFPFVTIFACAIIVTWAIAVVIK